MENTLLPVMNTVKEAESSEDPADRWRIGGKLVRIQSPLPFRIVVVSNRGPYHFRTTKHGFRREKTVGGLVTSMLPLLEEFGGLWIAGGEPAGRYPSSPGKPSFDLRYIGLTPEQIQGYYYGLANNALWPLCHYFMSRVNYDEQEWQVYQQVNQQFADVILEEAQADDVIWVQDYHLTLIPGYLRQKSRSARIAFFWHIPFPATELFRTLPWRRTLLESMLACDLVGFHIPEYAENFIEAAIEVLDAQLKGNSLEYAEHTTQVLARPIGIDYAAVNCAARAPHIEQRVRSIRQNMNEQTVILGVERLDYTKGIFERLEAMEHLLEQNPILVGKITLIQIVTPSRANVEAYRQKKREIDEIVGRINGRFSNGAWLPIHYFYHAVSPTELIAYYRAADIALVTPLRDGLNLVAKEFVASRVNGDGVLILSEFAGAVHQLSEALLVNPYSTTAMVETLSQALQMPQAERCRRMQAMQQRIKMEDIHWWGQEFINRMAQIKREEA